MAEQPDRRDFQLAILAGGLTFFVLVPVAMAWVLGDRIHAYDKEVLFGFDLACTLLMLVVFYAWTQRWWRELPPRARWRKAATIILAVLVAPVLGVALAAPVAMLLFLALH